MTTPFNPYQPPQEQSQLPPVPPPGGIATAPCYRCGHTVGKKINFTWWGGALGPWMLSHVTCQGCGTAFNSKTGQSNNTAIAIYLIVGVVIGLIVGVASALVG